MSWASEIFLKKSNIISRFTNARSVERSVRSKNKAFAFTRLWFCFARSVQFYRPPKCIFWKTRAFRLGNNIGNELYIGMEKSFCRLCRSACCENIVGISTNKREDLSTFDYRQAALNFIFQYGYSRGKKGG